MQVKPFKFQINININQKNILMKKLFTILTFAIAFNTFGQVPNYVPTNGLVGWWPFNGNANDESGNGIHGTVSGASLTTDRFGQTNSAYYFNGTSDYIRMTGLPTNYSSYTYAGWVQGNTTSFVDHGIIIQTGINTINGQQVGSFGISAFCSSPVKYDGRHRQYNTSASGLICIPSINNPDLNWHFYTLTWDGGNLKFYVDNNLQGTLTGITGSTLIVNELIIGALRYGTGTIDKFYNGKIDDIGVWNRALSRCEIYQLYQSTISPDTSSETIDVCDSYTWAINGQTYFVSGVYQDTLTNIYDCDSIVTLNLTIKSVDISVSNNDPTLLAIATPATYQWVNCDNFNHLPDAIYQALTPTANGYYACIVTQNGCIDTTDCFPVATVGIMESSFENKIMVYPNPTDGKFVIDIGSIWPEFNVEIRDITGKVIDKNTFFDAKKINAEILNVPGVYIVHINFGDQKAVIRIIKK